VLDDGSLVKRSTMSTNSVYSVCVYNISSAFRWSHRRVTLRDIEEQVSRSPFFFWVGGRGELDKIWVSFNYHYGLSEKHTEY